MNGIIILTLTAFILSLLLVFIHERLSKKDKKIDKIIEHLPGINCGTCGYGSCEGMANAILVDKSNYEKCKILRGEKLEEMQKFLREE